MFHNIADNQIDLELRTKKVAELRLQALKI
jgi:hypothetical protein